MEAKTEQSISFSSFIDYRRVIFTMGNDLKKLKDYSVKFNYQKSTILIDEVLKRIENDSFTVAVVGEFKRGKSTFINALLGQEILPSDILPCSATLNRVTYGLKPSVKVIYKNEREEEIPIEQMMGYVTKLTPESEALATTIKEAIVYYPVHYCQQNVEIIDTPGLNEDENMTAVTLSVLPKVDAAILVIMAQAPFSEYERDFLENKLLTQDLGRVLFAVNAIDRVNVPEDRERVVKSVASRIKKYVIQRAEQQYGKNSEEYKLYLKKIGEPKIFGISAYQAIKAKIQNDPELLIQSCFPMFEQALEKFLTEDRGAILLQVPVNRAITSAAEILKLINIQIHALDMKKEEFTAAYESAITEITTLRQRKAEELNKIDEAAERAKNSVRPLLGQLENELKLAAERIIAATPIQAIDLDKSNIDAFREKLARKISDTVRNASQRMGEKIQFEIRRELITETERLQNFLKSVDQTLNNIEIQFVHIEADTTTKRSASVESAVAAVAAMTTFGGIWSGYRQAGLKGAVAGGVASLGTVTVGGIALLLLNLPFDWPAVLILGLVSIFTGGWLTRKLFGGQLVDNFKINFRTAVVREIEQQLKSQGIEQKVNNYISDSFDALKRGVHEEVEALLDNTQTTLAELHGKRKRDETLNEQERVELQKINAETQRILGNAQRLSDQLVQILNV